MIRKSIFGLAAAFLGSGLIATAVHSESLGHHDEDLSAASQACLAVIRQDQRAPLNRIFADQKDTVADRKALLDARRDVNLAVLTKGDAITAEKKLSAAKAKVQYDEDLTAAKICGLLDKKQLDAAQELYTNLTDLSRRNDDQEHNYFKAARDAAGDPAGQNAAENGPQNAE
jgi:hypothetical protein